MKKSAIFFLLILVFLISGCAKDGPIPREIIATAPPATQAPTAPAEDGKIHTVDEFLAALGSDQEILLGPGTFDLTTASDYGQETDSGSYYWLPVDDGYTLVLSCLYNTSIRGSGMDQTRIVTQPRSGSVLELEYCNGVTLSDFTAGHTESPQPCSSSVIHILSSEDVMVQNAGLFGCGYVGLDAYYANHVTLRGCDIYDCTNSGILADSCSSGAVQDCRFYRLGQRDAPAGSAFELTECSNFFITDTTVSDSTLSYLIHMREEGDGEPTIFRNVTFSGNRVTNGALELINAWPVFDNVNFEDNQVRYWFTYDSMSPVSIQGQWLTEADFPPYFDPSTLPEQKTVHASTVDEFLAAIGPNRRILLDSPVFHLSEASDYGGGGTAFYTWKPVGDGYSLVISDIQNLSIDGGENGASLVAASPSADVLTFLHCGSITLKGLTLGHRASPGDCTGDVLYFFDDDDITVQDCDLYGCGYIGIHARYARNFKVLDSYIHDCSQGGISMSSAENVALENTVLENTGSYGLSCWDCHFVTVDGEPYSE